MGSPCVFFLFATIVFGYDKWSLSKHRHWWTISTAHTVFVKLNIMTYIYVSTTGLLILNVYWRAWICIFCYICLFLWFLLCTCTIPVSVGFVAPCLHYKCSRKIICFRVFYDFLAPLRNVFASRCSNSCLPWVLSFLCFNMLYTNISLPSAPIISLSNVLTRSV